MFMSYGSTISRKELTEKETKIIKFCQAMSNVMKDCIPNANEKKEFHQNFGKISFSRDAGSGRGAGKLQRDALTTRGSGTGNAPISNRNLRWHPVTIAQEVPPNQIEGQIRIHEFSPKMYKIILIVNGEEWDPEDTYKLEKTVCISEKAWASHTETLRNWKPEDWRFSRYTIRAFEYSTPKDCIEAYAVLGLAAVSAYYEIDINDLYDRIMNLLENSDFEFNLPGEKYPTSKSERRDITKCPLCLASLSKQPANLEKRERPPVFIPPWRTTKRKEGDDASLQIMHIRPLVEQEVRHDARNVRYGHRWCNVAMTDHSVPKTLEFMRRTKASHEKR